MKGRRAATSRSAGKGSATKRGRRRDFDFTAPSPPSHVTVSTALAQEAIEAAELAILSDKARDYPTALERYKSVCSLLMSAIKSESSEMAKTVMREKLLTYIDRAELIRKRVQRQKRQAMEEEAAERERATEDEDDSREDGLPRPREFSSTLPRESSARGASAHGGVSPPPYALLHSQGSSIRASNRSSSRSRSRSSSSSSRPRSSSGSRVVAMERYYEAPRSRSTSRPRSQPRSSSAQRQQQQQQPGGGERGAPFRQSHAARSSSSSSSSSPSSSPTRVVAMVTPTRRTMAASSSSSSSFSSLAALSARSPATAPPHHRAANSPDQGLLSVRASSADRRHRYDVTYEASNSPEDSPRCLFRSVVVPPPPPPPPPPQPLPLLSSLSLLPPPSPQRSDPLPMTTPINQPSPFASPASLSSSPQQQQSPPKRSPPSPPTATDPADSRGVRCDGVVGGKSVEEGSGARGTRRFNDGGGGPGEEQQHWNPMGKRKNGGLRARRRLRVWLDVDTGIDDAHALMLALRSPELDVVGVSCVAGNNDVDTVTVATLKVMDACFGPPSEGIGCSGKNSLPRGAGRIDKPFDDDDRGCSSSSSDDDDDNGGSGESSLKEGGGRARSSIGRPRRRRPRTTAPLVAKGCAAPLLECCRPCPQIHGKDSLGDLTPPPMPAEPTRRAHPTDAVTLLVQALERCGRKKGPERRGGDDDDWTADDGEEDTGRPITIIALAPLTNIAMALRRAPGAFADRTKLERIVWMGGALAGGGNATAWAEANAFYDPEAAAAVLSSGVPITMYTWDVYQKVEFSAKELDAMGLGLAAVTEAAEMAAQAEAGRDRRRLIQRMHAKVRGSEATWRQQHLSTETTVSYGGFDAATFVPSRGDDSDDASVNKLASDGQQNLTSVLFPDVDSSLSSQDTSTTNESGEFSWIRKLQQQKQQHQQQHHHHEEEQERAYIDDASLLSARLLHRDMRHWNMPAAQIGDAGAVAVVILTLADGVGGGDTVTPGVAERGERNNWKKKPAVLTRAMHVAVELKGDHTRGMTVCDQRPMVFEPDEPKQPPNVDVCVDVDGEQIKQLFADRVLLPSRMPFEHLGPDTSSTTTTATATTTTATVTATTPFSSTAPPAAESVVQSRATSQGVSDGDSVQDLGPDGCGAPESARKGAAWTTTRRTSFLRGVVLSMSAVTSALAVRDSAGPVLRPLLTPIFRAAATATEGLVARDGQLARSFGAIVRGAAQAALRTTASARAT